MRSAAGQFLKVEGSFANPEYISFAFLLLGNFGYIRLDMGIPKNFGPKIMEMSINNV
jgi:hypothetical protein